MKRRAIAMLLPLAAQAACSQERRQPSSQPSKSPDHASMAIPSTGDPDTDFLRAMIPHHQGAINMARVELAKGTDPKVRALAEQVIAAQQVEITRMEGWLAERKVAGAKR